MKIQLTNDDIYEIKIPEKINSKEFLEILDKLNKLNKLINIQNPTQENTIKKERNNQYKRRNKNPFYDTREKVLDILQYHFHGTKKDKKRIAKLMNNDWKIISKSFYNLIKRYDIKPEEIGVIKFREKSNIHQKVCMKDWIIKSYTGVFDENENNGR